MTDLSLLQDFIVETIEYLEEMEGSLLRLEAEPGNRMMLDDIFRSIHTIKGAAEYLGIERIASLSGKIENLLYHQLRLSDLMVNQDVIDLIKDGRQRIVLLIENLQQNQIEQADIDDLIERLQVLNTTFQISEATEKIVSSDDNNSTEIFTDGLPKDGGLLDSEDEDEYDEELLAIFLDQLEEKLTDLQIQITALYDAEVDDQIAILAFCLAQINPLHSSANYMGYSQLTSFYEVWEKDIQKALERLRSNDTVFMSDFIINCMQNKIEELVIRYPRLQIPGPAEKAVASTEPCAEVKISDESETVVDFSDIVGENDAEPDDILDAYAEGDSSSAPFFEEKDIDESQDEANLFDRLSWSFDNRIKQNLGQATESDRDGIEAELFSTVDSLPDPSQVIFNTVVKDDRDEAPDVVERKIAEIEISESEAPGTENLFVVDDYNEDNDEELSSIFLDQLQESLIFLKTQATSLQGLGNQEQIVNLDKCLARIDLLSSSANYMGYEHLTSFYDDWVKEIAAIKVRLLNHEDGLILSLIARMLTNIENVSSRFPKLSLNEDDPTPAETVLNETVKTAPSESIPSKPLEKTDKNLLLISNSTSESRVTDTTMLPDFIVESREHLEEMEENLLHLNTHPNESETLDDIFRSVHTIKGAAEYIGIERIANLTHHFEDLLYKLRQNELTVNREMMDLLMAGWDRINLLNENLDQFQSERVGIEDLLERIRVMDKTRQDDKIQENQVEPIKLESSLAGQQDEKPDPVLNAAQAELNVENEKILKGSDRRNPNREMRRQSELINEKNIKQSIRVDAAKIDALMNQVGELVVSRAGFTQLLSDMRKLQYDLKQNLKLDIREMRLLSGMTMRLSEATSLFGKVANELQEEVMKVRMLPISQLFNRYSRLVFDLVRDTEKQVRLNIFGEETELDKMVIEEISDPLIHIIRNAVDHGLETVDERIKKGKPEIGTIRLEAYHEGNHIVIEIMDDGRGLDLKRIKEKALSGNFVTANELERMSAGELTGLIMKPGFTTAESVTHISGRGVGMDVVRKNIEKLNGTIEIDTVPEVETRIRIKIPLTLAIIPALRVQVGMELFTIPLSTVEETLRINHNDISTIEGAEVMSFRATTLPLVRLTGLFGLESSAKDLQREFIVVVSTGMKRVGLVVDDLLGQEEVVIKPMEDYLQEKSGFSGATILGDGRISLILDVYELINLSIDREVQNKAMALPV